MHSKCSPSIVGVVAIVAVSMLTACGEDDVPAADTTTSTTAAETTTTTPEPETEELSGSFDVGGRELAITCLGTGSPTVILEPGEGEDHTTFTAIQRVLSERTRACTYDRANIGDSGEAPTPRTTDEIVDDVRALLGAAGVDGPYVLVGRSAGATISLHHAKRHPDDVAGVLAMNPVPFAAQWVARAYPLLTQEESAGETAYYAAENGESIDYTASGEQHDALAAPDAVSLILLHSDETQCEGDLGGPCGKTADLYITLGEEYAAAWPGARFEAVAERHAIEQADQTGVVELIEELLDA